jgi:hypothetical protein
MTPRIAATDGGTSYHDVALSDPRWAACIDARLYLPELSRTDLSAFDVLIVTCRSNPAFLVPEASRLAAFLDAGKTVVAFAETEPQRWLPNVCKKPVAANYWWWLKPDADSGLRVAAPQHPLLQAVPLADMTWHHHARFRPPSGAVSLVDHVDGGSVFYEDRVSTRGRLLIAGLDPFYHHGSYFMPATTRFLDGFLHWIRAHSYSDCYI